MVRKVRGNSSPEEEAMPYPIPLIIYLAVALTWARIFRRVGWSRWQLHVRSDFTARENTT